MINVETKVNEVVELMVVMLNSIGDLSDKYTVSHSHEETKLFKVDGGHININSKVIQEYTELHPHSSKFDLCSKIILLEHQNFKETYTILVKDITTPKSNICYENTNS